MSLKDEIVISESGQRMMGYVLPIYDFDRFMLIMFQINGMEVDDLRKWTRELREQAFPQTATWGLRYLEQRMGLPVNESLPVEERRRRILTKMTTEWPVTPWRMQIIASEAAGLPAEIIQNVAAYTFRVLLDDIGGESASLNLVRVQEAIEEAKPAHLAYELGIRTRKAVGIATSSQTLEVKTIYCGTFLSGQRPGGVF
jgi:hypothetical protein